MDILQSLQKHVNFTYDINSENLIWGFRNSSGFWKGMIGDLVYNISDIAIQSVDVSVVRSEVI